MSDWVTARIAEFEKLLDHVVGAWDGIEILIGAKEDGSDDVQESSAPFLQLLVLELTLEDDRRLRIHTYQDDDVFGLMLEATAEPLPEFDGDYRRADLNSMPLGLIEKVETGLSERGNIGELSLQIDGVELILVAGEVYEQEDNRSLRIVRDDESVLLFRTREAYQSVAWYP